MTRRTIETTSTSVSTTRPDLSPLPAKHFWRDFRYVAVRVTLISAILGPIIQSGEYLYFRVVQQPPPAATSPPIPAPFVRPGIIVVAPPAETEPNVAIPDTQRRYTPGKHRAPEETAPSTTSSTPVLPQGKRRVAPSTTPEAPSTTPSVPPPSGSSARSEPPTPTVTSSTPIYDTLRNERLATDPNLESVIPQ